MIVVDDKKYACETCIKGHRSSGCKHADRPLFEIKKKGRPVTQCEHCRELRKTKQVHVKCLCEAVPLSGSAPVATSDATSSLPSAILNATAAVKKVFKKATKLPSAPAFPNGAPGATVLLPETTPPPPTSASASHIPSLSSSTSCHCKSGESCSCCSAPTSSRSKRKPGSSPTPAPTVPNAEFLANASNTSGFRPVLPRPVPSSSSSSHHPHLSGHGYGHRAGPTHETSSGSAHASRYQSHENLFSPYARAYDGHLSSHNHSRSSLAIEDAVDGLSMGMNVNVNVNVGYAQRSPAHSAHGSASALSVAAPWGSEPVLGKCGCGATCACPGCGEHAHASQNGGGHGQANGAQYDCCANPERCSFCLQCSVNQLVGLGNGQISPGMDPVGYAGADGGQMQFQGQMQQAQQQQQQQQIVDWLQQVPQPQNMPSNYPGPGSLDISGGQDPPFDFSAAQGWDAGGLGQAYGMDNSMQALPQTPNSTPAAKADCCGSWCWCPVGQCQCVHANENGSQERLTFATSGLRASCCAPANGNGEVMTGPVPLNASAAGRGRAGSTASSSNGSYAFANGAESDGYYAVSSSGSSRAPSVASMNMNTNGNGNGFGSEEAFYAGSSHSGSALDLMEGLDGLTSNSAPASMMDLGASYEYEAPASGRPQGVPFGERQETIMPRASDGFYAAPAASASLGSLMDVAGERPRGVPFGEREETIMPSVVGGPVQGKRTSPMGRLFMRGGGGGTVGVWPL